MTRWLQFGNYRRSIRGGRGARLNKETDKEGNPIPYGSKYHTLFQNGNIKFIKMNDSTASTTAPMETQTKNRVYVTISNDSGKPKFVTYYDKENMRYKQIDLSGIKHKEELPSGRIKILDLPHAHLGYIHSENGARRLTDKERKLIDRINKLWDNYISK